MKLVKKLVSALASAAMAVTAMPVLPLNAAEPGFGLATRTPKEIRAFLAEHPWSLSDRTTYAETPSTSQPYAPGAVSEQSLQRALNCVNFCRYAAGLPADVTLDESACSSAQAASLVSALNGVLSHAPNQPAGMSDELFERGKTGAGSSNLAGGYSTLPEAIINGYMYDSDSYNIPMVGHRRWILNPSMSRTGFGQVGSYSGMYVFDMSRREEFVGDYVAWPAKNTPYQLIRGNRYAYSVSLSGDYEKADAEKVSVLMHSEKKNKDYIINQNSGSYFNVNTQGYGMPNCVIFSPGESFDMDDRLTVTLTGLTKKGQDAEISYPIQFFDLYAEDTDTETTTVTTTEETTTTTTTTYQMPLRTGEILFNISKPGTEFKITVTPRGQTIEDISLRYYGVNGGMNDVTVLNKVITGTTPYVTTVRAPFVTNKVNVSVTYRGDAPSINCVCTNSDSYESDTTTAPADTPKVYTVNKVFSYDQPGTKYRLRVEPAYDSPLQTVLLRFFSETGKTSESIVFSGEQTGTFEQEIVPPFATKKITAVVSFCNATPKISCEQTEAVQVTEVTTVTEQTVTTPVQFPLQTLSLKFSFPQSSENFRIAINKKGGTLEQVVLRYDEANGGEHEVTLNSEAIECPKRGLSMDNKIGTAGPVSEIRLEVSFRGSAPEVKCMLVKNDGSEIEADSGMCGDVDCDGHIMIADAILLARYNAEDSGITVTPAGKINADTDHDGLIGASDCALLLEYLAGLRTAF